MDKKKCENFSRNWHGFDREFIFSRGLRPREKIPNDFWWSFAVDRKKEKFLHFSPQKRKKMLPIVTPNFLKNKEFSVCVVIKYRFLAWPSAALTKIGKAV